MGYADTLLEGQGFAASGDIQSCQASRFGLTLQEPCDETGHVVYVDELNLVVEILLSEGQHAGQTFALLAHARRTLAFAVGRSTERSHQIILDAGSDKNMGPQNKHTAASQCRRPLLHH